MTVQEHIRTCPLCEATCGLSIRIDGGRVTRVRGDRDDVFSAGYICPKGSALGHLQEDPDRLRRPLVRRGDTLVETTWDEAIAECWNRLSEITSAGDPNAVALYLGNPSVHALAGMLFGSPLIKAFRTRNVFTASTVDQMPRHVSAGLMYGNPGAIPVPDLDRANYLLILGANPHQSNGSLCTAPDFMGRLDAVRSGGGKVVVVDPRRSETAQRADEHVSITPGTDAAWLAAVVHTILGAYANSRPGGLRPELVDRLDELRDAFVDFSPEAVAAWCGVDAPTARRIAAELIGAPVAAVYGRVGVHTTVFGTLCAWLTDLVTALVGGLDREGGLMFPLAAIARPDIEGRGREGRGFRTGRWHSRVGGYPEVRGEFPVAALADEIITPGEGRIRALITVAGNPVRSTPDTGRLDDALGQLDFMVSVDPYLNETTRHADVILPPPGPLGEAQFDAAFQGLSIRNVVNWSDPILESDGWPEYDILAALALIGSGFDPSTTPLSVVTDLILGELAAAASRLAGGPLEGVDPADLVAAVEGDRPDERIVDMLVRCGAYGDAFGRRPDGLTLSRLKAEPHGIDLGALQPRLEHVVATRSGVVEFAPEELVADLGRLAGVLHADRDRVRPAEHLMLIGRRQLRSNNSWMHNIRVLMKGRERCTLLIHPDDAGRRGLGDGELASVRSDVGELTIPVEVSDEMRAGVVSIPHGWGHDADGTRMKVAHERPGADINVLVPAIIDPLSGNGQLNGVTVIVEPLRDGPR